jgi:hypothetical protein
MPERIGFCFTKIRHLKRKKLKRKPFLSLKEKTMKYYENMSDEDLFKLIKEIDDLDYAYKQEKNYHDNCEPKWIEEIDEATGDILLHKAALNRGQP